MIRSNLSLSPQGVQFIAGWEGLELKPYKDVGGKLTIGYGHLICERDSGEVARWANGITKEEAEELLAEDVNFAEHAANNVGISFRQHEFDALVPFIFNCGVGNFNTSTMKKKMLTAVSVRGETLPALWDNEVVDVAVEFLKWYKVRVNGQLV